TGPVGVDVVAFVVGPDRLELIEGPQQWAVVPETDVLDRRRVPLEGAGVEGLVGREATLLDAVEPVRLARHPDVVLDERPLGDELVRRYDEPLQQCRDDGECGYLVTTVTYQVSQLNAHS